MAEMSMKKKMMFGMFAPPLSLFSRVKSQVYLRQCQRLYCFQPIYRTNGELLGIELLTRIFHPKQPTEYLSPERYFVAITISKRLEIVREQLDLLQHWAPVFAKYHLMASVNVDGQVLEAIQTEKGLTQQIAQMPYLRFELVEHAENALNIPLSKIEQSDRLWLDDFGEGIANFCSFTAWKYQYIKIARDLFMLLSQSDAGRQLLKTLVTITNRYSQGVIVEGVETEQEWAMVCDCEAYAAQGYYLSRPQSFDLLQHLPFNFAAR
jgi:EAL domain-containing protein (putative c-di-GMP-specific phosphodiesterase class I)